MKEGGARKDRIKNFHLVTEILSGGEKEKEGFIHVCMSKEYKKEQKRENVVKNLIQTYNALGRKETDRITKQHLMNCLVKEHSRLELHTLGLKFSDTTYEKSKKSSGNVRERKQYKSKDEILRREKIIMKFLYNNSSIAANRRVWVRGENHSCRYLNGSLNLLFLSYLRETPEKDRLQKTKFEQFIKKEKIFKKAKKATDMCDTCCTGKKALARKSKVESVINEKREAIEKLETRVSELIEKKDIITLTEKEELNLSKEKITKYNSDVELHKKEVKELEITISLYEKHRKTANDQRNAFKYKKSLERLKKNQKIKLKHVLSLLILRRTSN